MQNASDSQRNRLYLLISGIISTPMALTRQKQQHFFLLLKVSVLDNIIVHILLEREAGRRGTSHRSWGRGKSQLMRSDKELPQEEQSLIKDIEIIAPDVIPEEIYKF